MKKLFTLMFIIAAMCPLSAEGLSFNVEDAIKEYKFDWPNIMRIKRERPEVILERDNISAPYVIREYLQGVQIVGDPYAEDPAPETITTNRYNQRLVKIPAGYLCNAIDTGKDTLNGILIREDRIVLNQIYNMDSIHILIKEKDSPGTFKDVSFQLDYKIVFKEGQYNNKYYFYENAGDSLTDKDLVFTFNYSPDYFTFKEFTSDKEYEANIEKEVTIEHEGMMVTLKTKTYAALIVSKGRKNIYYVLEPNFENLYKFKFVREGKHTTFKE